MPSVTHLLTLRLHLFGHKVVLTADTSTPSLPSSPPLDFLPTLECTSVPDTGPRVTRRPQRTTTAPNKHACLTPPPIPVSSSSVLAYSTAVRRCLTRYGTMTVYLLPPTSTLFPSPVNLVQVHVVCLQAAQRGVQRGADAGLVQLRLGGGGQVAGRVGPAGRGREPVGGGG